jgi:hypothetical protein
VQAPDEYHDNFTSDDRPANATGTKAGKACDQEKEGEEKKEAALTHVVSKVVPAVTKFDKDLLSDNRTSGKVVGGSKGPADVHKRGDKDFVKDENTAFAHVSARVTHPLKNVTINALKKVNGSGDSKDPEWDEKSVQGPKTYEDDFVSDNRSAGTGSNGTKGPEDVSERGDKDFVEDQNAALAHISAEVKHTAANATSTKGSGKGHAKDPNWDEKSVQAPDEYHDNFTSDDRPANATGTKAGKACDQDKEGEEKKEAALTHVVSKVVPAVTKFDKDLLSDNRTSGKVVGGSKGPADVHKRGDKDFVKDENTALAHVSAHVTHPSNGSGKENAKDPEWDGRSVQGPDEYHDNFTSDDRPGGAEKPSDKDKEGEEKKAALTHMSSKVVPPVTKFDKDLLSDNRTSGKVVDGSKGPADVHTRGDKDFVKDENSALNLIVPAVTKFDKDLLSDNRTSGKVVDGSKGPADVHKRGDKDFVKDENSALNLVVPPVTKFDNDLVSDNRSSGKVVDGSKGPSDVHKRGDKDFVKDENSALTLVVVKKAPTNEEEIDQACRREKAERLRQAQHDWDISDAEWRRQKRILADKEAEHESEVADVKQQEGVVATESKDVTVAKAAVAKKSHCPPELEEAREVLARMEAEPNQNNDDINDECKQRKKVMVLENCVEQLRKAEAVLAGEHEEHSTEKTDLANENSQADDAAQAVPPQEDNVDEAKEDLDAKRKELKIWKERNEAADKTDDNSGKEADSKAEKSSASRAVSAAALALAAAALFVAA